MKALIKSIAVVLVIAFLLSTTTFAMSPDMSDDNIDERETQILNLLDQRQLLLLDDVVDIAALNAIDLQLHNLNVDFLTQEEVEEVYPEAAESVEKNIETASSRAIELPESVENHWVSYTTSNYLYDGQYYNIQRLVAQPLSEDSPLWDEGAKTVKFNYDWEAGATELIKCVAKAGISELAPITTTVYDALSAGWSGLRRVSTIDPGDVIYRWENATNVVFSYVRLESQPDSSQMLVLIATKCVTDVGYIVDIDAWSENGDGTSSPVPAQKTGNKTLNNKPTYYNFVSRACAAYNSYYVSGNVVYDRITRITISAPESKTVVNIYPCCPEFPTSLET